MSNPENPPRWAPDPLGRNQYRYWDGTAWTEHVSTDGIVSSDPPVVSPPTDAPSTPAPTPGTGATARSGVGMTTPGASPPGWPRAAQHDPTSVLGRRYGAFVIDAVLCLIVFTGVFLATATSYSRAEALQIPGCHLSANDSSQVECNDRVVLTVDGTVYEGDIGIFSVVCIAFTFAYFAMAEGLFGASLGKAMTGIRVVDRDGNRVGLLRASARWVVFAVDGPLSLYLCGIITSSVSVGHRRLGDMAAGSYVVGRADAGRVVVPR